MPLPAREVVCGPIAPRREPSFLSSTLRGTRLLSSPCPPSSPPPSLWQGSFSRPHPPLPPRLSSSYRNGPDGFPPPGLPVARADRPTRVQCRPDARSSCRALITVRPPRSTRLPPGLHPCLFLLPFTPRALSLPLSLSRAATRPPPTPLRQVPKVFVGPLRDEHTPGYCGELPICFGCWEEQFGVIVTL